MDFAYQSHVSQASPFVCTTKFPVASGITSSGVKRSRNCLTPPPRPAHLSSHSAASATHHLSLALEKRPHSSLCQLSITTTPLHHPHPLLSCQLSSTHHASTPLPQPHLHTDLCACAHSRSSHAHVHTLSHTNGDSSSARRGHSWAHPLSHMQHNINTYPTSTHSLPPSPCSPPRSVPHPIRVGNEPLSLYPRRARACVNRRDT